MRRFKVHFALAFSLLLAATSIGRSQQQATPPRPQATLSTAVPAAPRLVVLIVVDQFRADYVNLYSQQWTGGLKRLLNQGAYFPLAAYPYGYTVTCPGHSTIGTGVYPYLSGIAGNGWWDRDLKKTVSCTEDPAAISVPFGGAHGVEHHSPAAFRAATFADELRAQAVRAPRIVSLSMKARSAIGMAGHPGPNTMVVWEEDDGTWATSTAYAPDTKPWPEVDAFVQAHPIAAAYGQEWTRLLPPASYLFADDGLGEPRQASFPHPLTSTSGKPDNAFATLWERSPMSDAYLGDLALTLTSKLQLGQRPAGTDMLAISFSALDLVGHAFGAHSHEVQDVLARLDQLLGRLLTTLDASVGSDRYIVALSSDHGVMFMPEQATALGMNAGRIAITATGELRQKLDNALVAAIGAGTHIANVALPQIYLAPGVMERLAQKPGAFKAVADALHSVTGIQDVYWSDKLQSDAPTDDLVLRAMRLSYVPGRSGDLMVVPKPYWIAQATGTTHGTPYGYDQRVPLVFFGAGIRGGRFLTPASPADIAPTLAFLTRVTMSRTSGRVLTEAIR